MSIRLDPRRVGVLKRLAGESGMRPGDLVRQWVEERLDAARQGIDTPDMAKQLADQVAELAARVAALEAAGELAAPAASQPEPAAAEVEATVDVPDAMNAAAGQPEPDDDEAATPKAAPRTRAKRVAAGPSQPRVALHDEMIAVLAERGPMPAAELAAAVAERGRYQPPRSGKPLDAAMISQRVSNPAYRARFTRSEGRIGLAESAE